MTDFETLRGAVAAYDAALQRYLRQRLEPSTSRVITESAELDRLYDAMLRAADIDPDAHGAPDA